jgi:hypothetical protein
MAGARLCMALLRIKAGQTQPEVTMLSVVTIALQDDRHHSSNHPRRRRMSIFGTIMSAIFGKSAQAAPAGSASGAPASAPAAAPAGAAPSSPSAAPSAPVDVAAIMDDLAGKAGQKLDWRKSIVDLMKLLDLDSSLGARKELAKELNYSGDTNDSASMNIWLHKQVMTKLAENGGKVPADLKH